MSNPSKAARQTRIQKVVAGLTKYYGNLPQVTFAGQTFAPAALLQFLQGDIAASDAVDQARASLTQLVQTERGIQAKTNPVLVAIRSAVLGQFGNTKDAAEVLAVFGYSPRSTRKPRAVELVAKAEKAEATRKARGTTGKKAKAKIKGAPNQSAPVTTPAPAKG